MQKHQATIKEIASALNVSASTVSRALQNDARIGLRTKQRVIDMAKTLHYIPNPAAVLLKKGKTFTVGVVLPHLTEEFFSMAITGIEDIISAKGYNVIISQSRDSYEKELKAVKTFISSRVDGVIASISAETEVYDHFEQLQEYGIPVVFFDRTPTQFPAHTVKCNVVEGAYQVTKHLISKNITKIALLNGPEKIDVCQERLTGYATALDEHQIEIKKEFVKFVNLSKEDTWLKMEELLSGDEIPQAVFAFNDYVALNAMQICKQKGYIPNKDIFFVSFANLPICTYMENPPIASVEQFAYNMGERSAELLLNVLENPNEEIDFKNVMIDTQLYTHDLMN